MVEETKNKLWSYARDSIFALILFGFVYGFAFQYLLFQKLNKVQLENNPIQYEHVKIEKFGSVRSTYKMTLIYNGNTYVANISRQQNWDVKNLSKMPLLYYVKFEDRVLTKEFPTIVFRTSMLLLFLSIGFSTYWWYLLRKKKSRN